MGKENYGFTLHCKRRFSGRFKDKSFSDDGEYKKFIKNNQEYDTEIKNKLNDIFVSDETKLIYTGKLGDIESINNECNYYVNLDEMTTFVQECKSNNILTCYKVDFGISECVDKITAKGILKEIISLQKKKDKEDVKIKQDQENLDLNINIINKELKYIKEMLKEKEDMLKNLNSQKELLESNYTMMNYQIDKLCKNLCFSIETKMNIKRK